ncbi:MAG: SdrD B-like domain-containing protein [Saprospiraceae bacterium]
MDDGASTVNLTEQIIGYGNFTNVMWTDGTNPVANPTAVMPAANTTYTLTADDANGCPGTAMVNVTVEPIPTFTYVVSDCDANGMRTITVNASISPAATLEYAFNLSPFGTDNTFTFEAVSTPQVFIEVRAEGGNCIVNETYTVVACAAPTTFDLALTKRLAGIPAGPYTPGSSVSFDVMVYNQGTETAFDIDVTDYFVPSELIFVNMTTPATTMGLNAVTVTPDGVNPSYEINELAPGDAVLVTLNFTVNAGFTGTSIINNAEIIDASDTDGGTTASDQDSPLTTVNDGTTNELATDNDIDDEALGTPGAADNPADEDDYDAALLPVTQPGDFDLALTKTLSTSTPGPFAPGDPVSFDVTVYNQGAVTAFDIIVEDYFNAAELTNVTFTVVGIPITTENSNTATIIFPGASTSVIAIDELMPGDAVTVTVTGEINAAFTGTSLVNNAEIIDASETDGGPTATDSDSPLTTINNGMTNELATDNDINDEAAGTPGTMDNAGDEDDYDPAQINVVQPGDFDLALTKTLAASPAGPYAPGDAVSFEVTVYNQGTVAAFDIDVADYFDAGELDFVSITAPTMTTGSNAVTITQVPTTPNFEVNELMAGDAVTVTLNFTIDAAFTGTSLVNNAEIIDASETDGGTTATDSDSPLTTVNDGTTNELATDGDIDDEAAGTPGTMDNAGDEDDYDPAQVTVVQATNTYSLGSTVFEDNDNDGMQDPGEMGIGMVQVQLFDPGVDGMIGGGDDVEINVGPDGILGTGDDAAGGMPTSASGDYFFQELPAGNYYVQIGGTEFGGGEPLEIINISSTPTSTADDETDNDDNGSQSGAGTVTTSPVIELGEADGEPTAEAGQGGTQDDANDTNGDMTVDFGFFAPVSLGDTTWVDLNANGLQDPTEPRIEGVTVTLFNANGTPVTTDAEGNPYTNTTTTNAMGFYEFTNLPPGSYYVVFDISTAPGSEFYTLTTNTGTDPADNSDADPNTGETGNTGLIPSGGRFPDLDAGVICNVAAEAGTGQTICATAVVDLTALGASITPSGVAGFGATWTSSGTGTFDDGAGEFGVATTYTPSVADITAGQVILTLTTDNPMDAPFNNPVCGPAMDEVMIIILKVDCGTFPWYGQ